MSNTTNLSESSWKDEFNRRIQAFAKITKIQESDVREKLSELGVDGESSDSLDFLDNPEHLKMTDLFSAFVDSKLAPIVRVRAAEPHLRGRDQEPKTGSFTEPLADAVSKLVDINRNKSDFTDEELLKRLDEAAVEEAKILNERTKGRPCIVFNKDGTVNIPISLELVRIAKRQATSKVHRIGNNLYDVRRAGEFPLRLVDESPLVPGCILVNGYCSETDTDWSNVDYHVRVLCRIYVTHCETTKLSKKQMREMVKDAAKGLEFFKENYGEAVLVYDRLESDNKLPTLKISSSNNNSKQVSSRDTGF